MLFIMVLMYTTAHHKVRAQCFEAFWYTHHLAFLFFIGLYANATGCFVRDSPGPQYIKSFPFYGTEHCLGYESWRFTIWPGIIYFGERIWREIRARRATRLSKVLVHPSGTRYFPSVFSIGEALTLCRNRCHGVAYHQAEFQIRRWPMVVHPGARCVWLAVASCRLMGVTCFGHFADACLGHSSLSLLLQRIHTFPSTSVKLVIGPMVLVNVLVQVPLSLLSLQPLP